MSAEGRREAMDRWLANREISDQQAPLLAELDELEATGKGDRLRAQQLRMRIDALDRERP